MRITLISLALALAGCGPSTERGATIIRYEPRTEANEAVGVYTQNGRPVLWAAASLPIGFDFGKETPEYLRRACRRAAETYNVAAGHQLFRIGDDTASGGNLITFGRERPTDANEVGLARISYLDGHIRTAHIDFNPAKLGEPGAGSFGADAEEACLHELGHTLGLTHQPQISSIMYPYQQPLYHKRDLSKGDRARLARYYGG